MRLIARILALVAMTGCMVAAPAMAQPAKLRLFVAEIGNGAAQIAPDMREALRARIEEGLAATKVFAVETRLAREADVLASESAYVQRARAQSIDLIIFPEVDALECFREARPITAMPGKYNNKARCNGIMRVRVISPATDELRTSFELDESLEKTLGVVDQLELSATRPQAAHPQNQAANAYRFTVQMNAQNREFVELSRLMSAALAERVYDDAYPPEVIEIIGDQIYISRGERGGVNVGDILTIHSKTGKQLRHPVTGEILGEATVKLGTLKITESQDDFAIGEIQDAAGAVEKGSIVRRNES